MGNNSRHSWLDAVKNAFRSPTKDGEKRSSRRRDDNEPEEEEKRRGKKRWSFRRHFSLETTIQHNAGKCANSSAVRICSGEEDVVRKLQPKMENPASEQRRAFEVAMAAAATAQAAVEIIRLTRPSLLLIQDQAALVIQRIFRGYLARRALMALKGVVKLQALIRGHNVRKRAKMTLQCIQSLVRVQALVCDQRRRLSCESSMFTHDNTLSKTKIASLEIETLIKQAKECSLKQGKTLAHALSQQISEKTLSEVSEEQSLGGKTWFRKDRNLCHPNPVKTIEVDYSRTPPTYLNKSRDDSLLFQSPRTPSSLKIKSIRRMSMSENSSCPLPRPNYMAATASATARFKLSPTTTPRTRQASPTTSHSARKRLSFPDHDNHIRCRGITQFDGQQMPYYTTD